MNDQKELSTNTRFIEKSQYYINIITNFYQRHVKLSISIILFLVVFFGGFIRFYDFFTWQEQTNKFSYNGKPQLTNFDGYYFLEQTQRILDKKQYGYIEQRYGVTGVFDDSRLSIPAEFLAVLYKIFGDFISLEMLAALVPVFLAPLFAIVMFFIGRGIGFSYFFSIILAILSITSSLYAVRTNLGVYDTDFLNITLIYMLFLWVIQWTTTSYKGFKKHLFLILLFVTAIILQYWWIGAAQIALPLAFGVFLIYAIFWWRPEKKEFLITLSIFISIYLLLELYFFFFKNYSFLSYVWNNFIILSLQKFIAYSHATIRKIDVLKKVVGDSTLLFFEEGISEYPDRFSKVAELKPTTLTRFIKNYFITKWTFYCSLLGILISPYILKKRFFLLLPIFLFSLVLFYSATRFNMFVSPALFLGLTIFFHFILQKTIKNFPHLKRFSYMLIICAVIFTVFPSVKRVIKTVHPGTVQKYASSFKAIEKFTPPNALIWTSWDTGFPMMYYTKRYVLSDGGTSSGKLLYYSYLPNSLPTQQMAANYMNFLSHRGIHMLNSIGADVFYSLNKSTKTTQFQNDLMRFNKYIFNMTPKEAKSFFQKNINFHKFSQRIQSVFFTNKPSYQYQYSMNYSLYQKLFYDVNPYLKDKYVTMKELFSKDLVNADDLIQFYFEESHKKNYFMLHYQMTRELGWYLYGSWDMKTKKSDTPVYINYHKVQKTKDGNIAGTSNLRINTLRPSKFEIRLFGKSNTYIVERIITHHENHVETKNFGKFFNGINFEWIPKYQYGVIMSQPVSKVVFPQLYVRNKHIPTKVNPSKNYFTKISEQSFLYQLWEINADTVPPRKKVK